MDEHQLLTADSYICLMCYKYFHYIATTKCKNSLHHTPSKQSINKQEVDQAIAKLAEHIESVKQPLLLEEFFELMACCTAKHIANELVSDQVMLLPSIYDDFVQRCLASKDKPKGQEVLKVIPTLR